MEELLFLGDNITLNNFNRYEWSPSEDVLDSLELSFEGTIMGIKKNVILPYLNEDNIKAIRMGRSPRYPLFEKVETDDDFYRVVATFIPLSEYR